MPRENVFRCKTTQQIQSPSDTQKFQNSRLKSGPISSNKQNRHGVFQVKPNVWVMLLSMFFLVNDVKCYFLQCHCCCCHCVLLLLSLVWLVCLLLFALVVVCCCLLLFVVVVDCHCLLLMMFLFLFLIILCYCKWLWIIAIIPKCQILVTVKSIVPSE